MRSEAGLGLRLGAVAGLLFLHLPMAFILLYAFTTEDKSYQFPPPGLTLQWFAVAWEREDIWRALWLSVRVGLLATAMAMALGTLAAAALWRSRFFGRDAVNLLLILPIALPGIVTGIALRSTFGVLDIPFSVWTIVVGHATFCIVVVYNNVIARLRRTSPNLIEASMDLGADGFQTFRHVLLPNIATALLAGGMLAFALSFDEVIVTTFTAGQQTTLPIWMLSELVRPRQRPVTNVVAVFVIAVTLVPILFAYWVTRGTEDGGVDGEVAIPIERIGRQAARGWTSRTISAPVASSNSGQVVGSLEIEPELGSGAKVAGEAQGGVGGNGARLALSDDGTDARRRHAQCQCQRIGAQLKGFHQLLAEHFPWMGAHSPGRTRRPGALNHGSRRFRHHVPHLPIESRCATGR